MFGDRKRIICMAKPIAAMSGNNKFHIYFSATFLIVFSISILAVFSSLLSLSAVLREVATSGMRAISSLGLVGGVS